MKRLFAAAACVGVGFVLGMAFLGTVIHVGAISPPAATQNGDTNGDGELDISDAVYLLQFLFSGGADIAAIDCLQSPTRAGVVATGQSTCLGEAGAVECSVAKARGQDAFYQLGCPLEGRFVDHGDGTVFDACTGLMWTKKHVDTDADGELLPADSKTWLGACQLAEDMSYLGVRRLEGAQRPGALEHRELWWRLRIPGALLRALRSRAVVKRGHELRRHMVFHFCSTRRKGLRDRRARSRGNQL